MCARLPPLQETLNQELQVADTRFVRVAGGLFQLMEVGVVSSRGCEQQQVAGVCEKATASVVIYTYRRTIV